MVKIATKIQTDLIAERNQGKHVNNDLLEW